MKKMFFKFLAILMIVNLFLSINIHAMNSVNSYITIAEFKSALIKIYGCEFSKKTDLLEEPYTILSGANASIIINDILGFDKGKAKLQNNLNIPENAKGAASILIDLSMVNKSLVEKEKLTLKDADVFINALKVARMIPNGPYALTQASLKDDFYNYANRKYLATTIHAEGGINLNFNDFSKNAEDKKLEILNEILKSNSLTKGTDCWKMRELYNMYLDKDGPMKSILKIKSYIDEIKKIKSIEEFNNFKGKYYKYFNIDPCFNINTIKDDMTKFAVYIQPTYSFINTNYISSSASFLDQSDLENSIAKLFEYVGDPENATCRAQAIINSEKTLEQKRICVESLLNQDDKNYKSTWNHMIDMTKKSKAFTYEKEVYDIIKTMDVYCFEQEYIKYIDDLYVEKNLPILKDYAIINIFYAFASVLGDDAKSIITGFGWDDSIEERAKSFVKYYMENALNDITNRKLVPKQSKDYVHNLFEKIKAHYGQRINSLTWMSNETKVKAIKKINSLKAYIAYPDENEQVKKSTPKVYEKSEGGNLIDFILDKYRLDYDEKLNNLRNLYTQNIWDMDLSFLNNGAFYFLENDVIFIPAITLQDPIYNPNASDDENLGGIGIIIAHEITHAFNTFGDQDNSKNWWTKSDYINYKKITDNLVKELSKIEFIKGHYLDGEMCKLETIADLAGVSCVLDMTLKYPNYDLSKVMTAWAKTMAARYSIEDIKIFMLYSSHAPEKVRVNFIFSQMDEFYKTFDIKKEDEMFIPKEKRIRIW